MISVKTPNALDYSTVQVPLADNRNYLIHIGAGLLEKSSTFGAAANDQAIAWIITNEIVAPLYASRLATTLRPHYSAVQVLVLPDGELHKDWPALQRIFDALLTAHADRHTTLYALGGGVTGDLTGFAAACYMRGVPFVQVPTTLLAQVDSSVGGKTAINHPLGKNMIGAFYQPLAVVCDLNVLRTLSARELSAGLAEVIKYGPIADLSFFTWLEANIAALRNLDMAALHHAVVRSCQIKAHIVAQDEREAGLRAVLNFGHTFGHAIEAGLGYGQWLHGEAVAAGMVMATHLAQRLGLVSEATPARLTRLVAQAGLPVQGAVLHATDNAGRYLALMRHDKKVSGGEIKFVLPTDEGRAVVQAAPDGLVREVIDHCCSAAVAIT